MYTIVVEADESGDFVVSVPALPGCLTHGKSIEECKVRAAEAIEVHIAGPEADGEVVPEKFGTPQLLTVIVAARSWARTFEIELSGTQGVLSITAETLPKKWTLKFAD